MDSLSKRKEMILKYIVKNYILNGDPISSRQIFKEKIFEIGSSTIRNEMCELEEFGFLAQPHISSGRIPTDLAFRKYVDSILYDSSYNSINEISFDAFKNICIENRKNIESKLIKISKLLSKVTKLTTIVLTPKYFLGSSITRLELVKVNNKKLLLVIVEENSNTHIEEIELNNKNSDIIKIDSLIKFNNFLNQNFYEIQKNRDLQNFNLSVINITESVFKEIYLKVLKKISFYLSFKKIILNKMHVLGKENLLNYPELSTKENLKKLFTIFEKKKSLKDLLNRETSFFNDNIEIKIGNEIDNGILFSDFSMITANYSVNNSTYGKISILGPKRLEYKRFINIMKKISQFINEMDILI